MKKKLFLRTTVMSTQKEEIKTNFMDQSFLSALNLNQEDREEPEKRKENTWIWTLVLLQRQTLTQAGLVTLTQDPLHLVKGSAVGDQIHTLHSWITLHRIPSISHHQEHLCHLGHCSGAVLRTVRTGGVFGCCFSGVTHSSNFPLSACHSYSKGPFSLAPTKSLCTGIWKSELIF